MTVTDGHDSLLDAVRFDPGGLLPAVAQDALTGEVRMVAYMNREALRLTLDTGVAHFWSRSRGTLWRKGETSGNTLVVRAVFLDCDGDSVLLHVEPAGPTCHTGAPSCFFRTTNGPDGGWTQARPLPELPALEATIVARRTAPAGGSYTRALLDGGPALLGAKIREEADELARAVAGESVARVASEAADVLYHVMVALASRDVPWRAVLAELARRRGTSGLAEKAARP